MNRAAGVLVVLLVVLAGCSSLPGDDGGPPGTALGPGEEAAGSDAAWPPTATASAPAGATAVDVRDDDVTRLPPSVAMNYPPGVAPDGVYDVGLLTASHARRLNQTSYTLEWTATAYGPDGAVRTRLVHHVESNAPAGRLQARVNATGSDDDGEWAAFRANGTTHVRGGDDLPDPPATANGNRTLRYDPARTPTVVAVLGAFDIDEVHRGRTGDRVRYLLRSDRLTDPDALVDAPDARVTNASLVVLLDGSAVVRHLEVEYDVHRNGTRIHHVRVLRVSLVGRTTVTRPAWVDADGTAGETTESESPDG